LELPPGNRGGIRSKQVCQIGNARIRAGELHWSWDSLAARARGRDKKTGGA
jgi:hypothetical protein